MNLLESFPSRFKCTEDWADLELYTRSVPDVATLKMTTKSRCVHALYETAQLKNSIQARLDVSRTPKTDW